MHCHQCIHESHDHFLVDVTGTSVEYIDIALLCHTGRVLGGVSKSVPQLVAIIT